MRVKRWRRGDTAAWPDCTPQVGTRFELALRRGSKALKGGTASRERLFARVRNAANPMVGSRVQHPDTVAVE